MDGGAASTSGSRTGATTMGDGFSVDRLHEILRDYVQWMKAWQPPLGYPGQVPYVRLMRPSLVHDGDHEREGPDPWLMRTVDSCVESLPSIYRTAFKLRWFARNATVLDASGMADEAERRLAKMMMGRGVVL